ncbi:Ribosome maturation factor RimM [bacterium HR40]|nr:Ribosome maturation factor RimM [bacterium HR40]
MTDARTALRRDLVCVAEVATAHGVHGALKLRCFTEAPENVAHYGPLLDERGREVMRIRILGYWRSGVIVEAEGVRDRTQAEFLRGLRLYVPRARLPEPAEEEYYHVDLIGLEVRDESGAVLGRVVAVQDYGAGELLEFALPSGRTLLVPFTRAAVPEVALAAGHVVVRREALAEEPGTREGVA